MLHCVGVVTLNLHYHQEMNRMVESRDNRQLRAKRRKKQEARLAAAASASAPPKEKAPAKGTKKS